MRYLMIDRVLYLESFKKLTAIKCVALSEDLYADHFFGNPIMPGAMQIETMAQAGTVLLEVSSRFTKKAVLVLINMAKFRESVRPGDQMRVEITLVSLENELAQTDGTIFVGDKLVTSGRLTFSLQPIDDYYPPHTRNLTGVLYDNFLRGATLVGVERSSDSHG
jgi:3-hydroxyacyl-[acyl-carrier-protein] dehydratase